MRRQQQAMRHRRQVRQLLQSYRQSHRQHAAITLHHLDRIAIDRLCLRSQGPFSLRRFFVFGTTSADGEDVAYETIRMKLQEIIDKEEKSNPLSDDDLVDELKKHGLGVARRTITKYRKKMGIPSSRQRRDWAKGV